LKDDLFYFEQAMILAREALGEGYSPVGAIIVGSQGECFPGKSKREIGNIYHAEYRALIMAQKFSDTLNVSLNTVSELTLYSTLEPCIMCSGMAAVMKLKRIAWLVDDVWAGASRVYNPNNGYIQKRFPRMVKVDIPHLHEEAQEMWVKYLRDTGHPNAVSFMLGLPEDYQCK
jgi:tRNA(Arg) A34 adenosine deaminase TadA